MTHLPKNWFILRNEENYIELNKYNNEKFYISAHKSDGAYVYSDKGYTGISPSYIIGYEEITFEQFKRWVLNKKPEYCIY